MSQYTIEAGTAQHIGDCLTQQDRTALLVAPRAPGYMMAILADGIGTAPGGALAAAQVMQTAQQNFDRFFPATDHVEALLKTIAHEAHTIIKLNSYASNKHPLSTMVALVLTPERQAICAHVGDSRLYRLDNAHCIQRTTDHTYVEKLLSQNRLSKEKAKNHPLSTILVNTLGMTSNDPFVTTQCHDNLKAGDAFLLCSGGLWRYFSDDEFSAIIAPHSPRQASEILIQKARERARGSIADNCSMVIVKLVQH